MYLSLKIGSGPGFTKKYGKTVKDLPHGSYTECRGASAGRWVQLPGTAVELADAIMAEFGNKYSNTHLKMESRETALGAKEKLYSGHRPPSECLADFVATNLVPLENALIASWFSREIVENLQKPDAEIFQLSGDGHLTVHKIATADPVAVVFQEKLGWHTTVLCNQIGTTWFLDRTLALLARADLLEKAAAGLAERAEEARLQAAAARAEAAKGEINSGT